MARYRALKPVFLASAYYGRGEEFESDLPPGRNWEPLDDAARDRVTARKFEAEPPMPGEHRTPLAEIPENWRSWKPLEIINLARKLAMGRGGLADATAWIERELAARENRVAA